MTSNRINCVYELNLKNYSTLLNILGYIPGEIRYFKKDYQDILKNHNKYELIKIKSITT